MKAKFTVLTVAVFSMLLPAIASAEQIKTKDNRGSGYGDGGSGRTTSTIISNVSAGRFYQWFGRSFACSSSAGKTCNFHYTTSSDVSETWQVGTELKTEANFGFGTADDTVNASYSNTVSHSTGYDHSTDIDPGYTAEAATFIPRNTVVRSYKGLWKLVATSPTGCGFLARFKCYYYDWKSTDALGTITAKVAQGSTTTFTFLSYANNQRPSKYVLERDPN
jgi:hypothetical protein